MTSLRTSPAAGRRSPWALLGTPVAHARSAHEALSVAGLAGWNIRKAPMTGCDITDNGVTTLDNPDKVMLVYTDPRIAATRYLSTVGKDYGIHQNEEGAALIDTLVAESGAAGVGHAGSLDNGRKTFVTIELPSTMRVDGVDPMQLHLVVFNSHDGSSAFKVMLVPFRIACANQINVAVRNHVGEVSIRHTRHSAINVADIRDKLGLLYSYSTAFEDAAKRMIHTEMTGNEFTDLIQQVWPVKDNAPARTVANAVRRTNQLTRLWTSTTQDNIHGTRWAAFQAVAEYLDHFGPGTARDRANRVMLSGTLTNRKQAAYDLLTT